LITADGDSEAAITAARFGACDFLTKPLDLNRLLETVGRAIAKTSERTNAYDDFGEINPTACDDPIVGRSRAMQAVFKGIGRVAKQAVAVLIRGESGTGKELVARAIWQHSDRADRTFLAVNCAAMSAELLESEMFGHEKGAFTGADHRHLGKFEACHAGTLFLDEIGDMPPSMQAKLLRVLQERRFTRVGGDEEISTDVRVISATNRDLEEMCQSGEFREDLYHRLNGFSIVVPPLRDRGADIRLLLGHCLHRFNQKLNKQIDAITTAAAKRLTHYYSWPGNVRELEAVLSQVMLNTSGTIIDANDVPNYISVPHEKVQSAEPDCSFGHRSSKTEGKIEGQFESFVDSLLAGASNSSYAETSGFVE
jgi:two-component system nitrogen regulation response regulator GlnG